MYKIVQADLHCHTQCSDGALSPRDVVGMAGKLGLLALGITDHDTISGWDEGEKAGRDFGIDILLGVELNTDWKGKEVHILGYGLNREDDELQNNLGKLSKAREQRILQIIEKLNYLHVDVSLAQVKEFALGDSVGRPHIAQALVAQGYAGSIREAFERYLEVGAPAYVDRHKLTTEEGIELVRKAGGVAVLAHPGLSQLGGEIKGWIETGLQGIEVFHPEHTEKEASYYLTMTKNYGLIPTGGSDFHGEDRKPKALLGKWGVGIETVDKIRELIRR